MSSFYTIDETATRWMLNHGTNQDPDVKAERHPLNFAARHASVNTINLLLEKGADPRKCIPLIHANKREDENWKSVMQLLLDYGCDINALNNPSDYRNLRGVYPGSVLHAVAAQDLCHMIPFFLEKGADPCKKSENGYTPAGLALRCECDEAASILLDAEKSIPCHGLMNRDVTARFVRYWYGHCAMLSCNYSC